VSKFAPPSSNEPAIPGRTTEKSQRAPKRAAEGKSSTPKLPKELESVSWALLIPSLIFIVAAIVPDIPEVPNVVRWSLVGFGIYQLIRSMRRAKEVVASVSSPLAELVQKTKQLAEGDLDQLIDLPTRDDELGELMDAFRRVVEAGRRDRQRLLQNNREMQEANERVLAAKQEVESYAFRAGEANIAKREFLAVMSHEIRTPVNGIIGMTELAMGTDLSSAQRDYLETINSCAESLLALLNDILDFSKIEAGKLDLEQTDFSLRELLGEALTTLAPRAHNKGLELLLHIRPEVPDMLIGDPHRLRQIVVNLVGNALKFTERGEVVVRVENSRWVEGTAELAFAIADTGIGIPADRRESIFQAFSQADYSTTRRFGGTGLGLAITQQLVALMKGDIKVDSEVGKGTVFRFTSRFEYRKSDQKEYLVEAFKGRRVLVLDAHPNSLRITTELLTSWQMKADSVRDVVGALSELRRAASDGNPYDLFVADAVRPESPGVKLASAIDSYPELASTRVVLLVSSPRRGEIDRFQNAAIRATLTKPVTTRSLRVAVTKALDDVKKNAGMSVPKSANFPAMRSIEILVAEDNAVNQRLVKLNLEQWGHKVTVTNDGAEAVDAFRVRSFDLVLMDLQMPNMSGFEASVAIRSIEKTMGTQRTPILALSANVLKGVRDECAKSGMDGYVSKPVRQQELLSGMGSVIQDLFLDPVAANSFLSEGSGEKGSPAPAVIFNADAGQPSTTPIAKLLKATQPLLIPPRPAPISPSQKVATYAPKAPVAVAPAPAPVAVRAVQQSHSFDAETLMANLGGDVSILAEVVKLCREGDAPRLLRDLANSLSKGDCVAAGKAAHGLKGMVGAFNATDAWTAAKRLEESAREGKGEVLLGEADDFVRSFRVLLKDLETYAGMDHHHVTWI
jgi:signal transduction histidine kinase/CheY-like chemotaxis protein